MVANDIRDPLMATFTADQIDSLINAGMMEVSRVYPKEMIVTVPPVADTFTYDVDLTTVFRVEVLRSGRYFATVDQNQDDSSQGGWEFFAGALHFPHGAVDLRDFSEDAFKVWGYADRDQLTADAQVADLDIDGEWGVRYYARWQAYQAMLADRNLYKQWQAASQNSDITPAQMQQSVLLFSGEWDRHRNHLRRLRRA